MENKEQKGYNFNSVDLLIYIWNKRVVLMIVGLVAAIGVHRDLPDDHPHV